MHFGTDETRDGVLTGRVRIGAITAACTLFIALGVMLVAQSGVPLPYLFVLIAAIVVGGVVVASWQARTMSYFDWLVARRQANGVVAAMAMVIAISGCWALLMAPGWYFAGSANAPAWTAALCVAPAFAAMLILPYYRTSGAPSQAAFLAHRFESRAVGLIALCAGALIGFLFLVATLATTAWLIRTQFVFPVAHIHLLIAGLAAFTVIGGGLRAAIRVSAMAFAFLAITYLAPAVWLSAAQGNPIPQLAGIGDSFAWLARHEDALAAAGGPLLGSRISAIEPIAASGFQVLAFAIVVGIGIGAAPVALSIAPAVRRLRIAQQAGGGSILLLALLLSVTPMLAVFAKMGLYEILAEMPLANYDSAAAWLPALARHSTLDHGPLAAICGATAQVETSLVDLCGLAPEARLGVNNVALAPEAVTFAVPQLAGIPPSFGLLMSAGLVVAGIGALAIYGFSIAASICAGLSPNPRNQGQAAGLRLFAGRMVAAVAFLAAALLASRLAVSVQDMFVWAASIGFGILAPVTIAAIWWSRANGYGAIAAMLMGGFVFLFLLEMRRYGIDFRPGSGDEFRIVFPGLSGLPDVLHMALAAALTGTLALVAISFATGARIDEDRLDAIRRPDTPPAFPDSFA